MGVQWALSRSASTESVSESKGGERESERAFADHLMKTTANASSKQEVLEATTGKRKLEAYATTGV